MEGFTFLDFKQVRTIHLLLLLLTGTALSILLHTICLPWWCGDSPGYAGPAWHIYHGSFAGYPGVRTPTYPLFLLGCEMFGGVDNKSMTPLSAEIVTWTQSLLHVATAPLLYLSMERLLIRRWLIFAFSLVLALLAGVAEYQMLILSESLCCFFMVLSIYLATVAMDRLRRGVPSAAIALLTGVTLSATILARPNILFLWILFTAAIPALAGWKFLRRRPIDAGPPIRKVTLPCFVGGALLLIAWLFVNYENTGLITLTTMVDVTRTSAAYNLFDRVHPEDKILGDIMVKYARQPNPGDPRNHAYVWLALPEIRSVAASLPIPQTGGTVRQVDIYHYLGRVSRYLLWENPGVWAQNSTADFLQTFDFQLDVLPPTGLSAAVSVLGAPAITNVTAWNCLSVIVGAEAWLILPLYLLTFAALIVALRKVLAARDLPAALVPLTVAAFAVSALACMIAPCVLATYFSRFSVPIIPLFVICSGYIIETALARPQAGATTKATAKN